MLTSSSYSVPFFEALAGLLPLPFASRLPLRSFRASGSDPAPVSKAVGQRAEALLSLYGSSVLRLAYAYLHSMEDAEEILQETWIRYMQTAPELAGPEHEKAWLLRVAANLSKNRLAYNRVRRTDELSEALAAEQREDLSFVWEAVKSLPPKYRGPIHLFYYEGLTTEEIADILHEKSSTVRSHLARGREKLKQILKEGYDLGDDL